MNELEGNRTGFQNAENSEQVRRRGLEKMTTLTHAERRRKPEEEENLEAEGVNLGIVQIENVQSQVQQRHALADCQ